MIGASDIQKFEQVVRKIEPHGKLLHAWALQGGISAQMAALEVGLPDGKTKSVRKKKLIVRRPGPRAVALNPQAAADEFRILQIVQAAGVRGQRPYALDLSGEIYPEPYLVIEYIKGQPEYAPANVNDYVLQMAAQLVKIHSIDSGRVDLSFLPQQAQSVAQAFKEQPAKLDHSLNEGAIRQRLAAVWPLPPANKAALLHGDFWPGNILWQKGEIVAVIDWEDAKVGDPLEDFAISRLDVLWILGLDAMHEFTQRYRSMSTLDFGNLPYWDLYAALRPASRIAEWAEGWAALGRSDITETTMRAGHSLFVAQAFEQLEIS